jgi:hypothetical protein
MAINLSHALRKAWCAETSVDPSWSPENPALGQCAVTALAVQDALGGELVRGAYDGGSHYWNRLPSGVEIDLTAEQFASLPAFHGVAIREREYVLSFAATRLRYELLQERMGQCFGDSR